MPSAGKVAEQLNLSCCDGGMWNGTAPLENSVTISCKTKHVAQQ